MRRSFEGLAWGLLIGLLGSLAALLPAVSELEQDFELRWLFRLRGPTQAPAEVVVVAIDEESAQKLRLPSKPSQWPRDLHAQLIDRLARAGAHVICFDLTFEAPSQSPQNDPELAAAIRRAANVVLTDSLRKEAPALSNDSARTAAEIEIERILPPIPILEQAALAHAPFPLPRQSRVDTYWTFKTGAGDRPTLPVIAFQVFAFDAYRHFLALLRSVAPTLQIAPPDTAGALVATYGAVGLNDTLRRIFLSDPSIGERMSGALENASDQELPPHMKRLVRSLLSLYQSSDVAYLNFRGPARTIATVPYYEVLSPLDADSQRRFVAEFNGKAVFVGFSAFSQPAQDRIRDDYETVFSQASGLNLSGVEIAATAFADLLDDRPVRPIPAPWQLGLLMAWGVALGAACRMLRPLAAGVLVSTLVLAYLALAVRQFTVAALWFPLLVPLCLQAPLAVFRGVLLNYRDARKERERIRQAVSHYLPTDVVDQLVEKVNPITAADRLVHGACLATDVEKYTTLAEQMTPTELGRLMNEYFAELFKPVERFGGFVSNLTGDAMLAIWAASSSHAPAGRQACLAALDIAEALQRFNQAVPGRPPMRTRLGLHSGRMLLGSIGASRHYQYEAMGDMVNTATRIQGLSKHLGTQILASQAAAHGLQEILTRPMGDFLLAGKSAPVSVVELLGRSLDVDARTALMCEKFAEALDAYRRRRWRDAASQFSEILRLFPEDGPSRFYLERCESYVLNPPDDSWSPAVRQDRK
jgi:adenylate cyclase